MSCNCVNNNHQPNCENSISFQLDGSYLVPFCGSTPLAPLDLSPVVQESETDTRLQLDQAMRRLIYTSELAQRGVSSPDSISIADIANLIKLNQLEDVNFAISSNGDLLSWDSTSGAWVSYTVPNGNIVTPVGVGADGNLVKDGSGGTPQAPDTVPLGGIIDFTGPIDSIPTSYRLANGQALSRTVYSDYFDLVGTMYGAGDGSTTFNIPNIGSRQRSGYNPNDTQYNVIGQTGGSKTASLSAANNGPHSHNGTTSTNGNHQHSPSLPGATGFVQYRPSGGLPIGANIPGNGTMTGTHMNAAGNHNHTFTTSSSGSGTPFSILDQYIVLPVIVRVL